MYKDIVYTQRHLARCNIAEGVCMLYLKTHFNWLVYKFLGLMSTN